MRNALFILTLVLTMATSPARAAQMNVQEAFERLSVDYWRLHGDIVFAKKFDDSSWTLVAKLQSDVHQLMGSQGITVQERRLAASIAGATFNLTGASNVEEAERTFPPVRDAFFAFSRKFARQQSSQAART